MGGERSVVGDMKETDNIPYYYITRFMSFPVSYLWISELERQAFIFVQ